MIDLRHKGIQKGLESPVVGIASRNFTNQTRDVIFIDETTQPLVTSDNPIVSVKDADLSNGNRGIFGVRTTNSIADGDIIGLYPNGHIMNLYREKANHNTLFVTERCNSNCIMCSQPPKDKDDIDQLFDINEALIPLIPKNAVELGITGGEPTLLGDKFYQLLKIISKELPSTEVHILTNGRNFAKQEFAERLSAIENPRIMLGIPLYSDFYQQHDYVVQASNAFHQTMLGFHNLAKYGIRLELRVVLHKHTYQRLPKLASYIYRNLPFLEHVTFMGMENTGLALQDFDNVWMEPSEYMTELSESVHFLSARKMNVSIYNTPLCLLPEDLWDFARKSISDWKNQYSQECTGCSKIEECAGFFTTSKHPHSLNIKPIL